MVSSTGIGPNSGNGLCTPHWLAKLNRFLTQLTTVLTVVRSLAQNASRLALLIAANRTLSVCECDFGVPFCHVSKVTQITLKVSYCVLAISCIHESFFVLLFPPRSPFFILRKLHEELQFLSGLVTFSTPHFSAWCPRPSPCGKIRTMHSLRRMEPSSTMCAIPFPIPKFLDCL